MDRIKSFEVNHLKLLPGIYLSRMDLVDDNNVLYTYDVRLLRPNFEPVMDTSVAHTIEHLGATYLRNVQYLHRCFYFGPMGCRTGFYFITDEDLSKAQREKLFKDMFLWIAIYQGEVPGASAKECGNYLDLNLTMAQFYAKMFLERMETFTEENYNYPKD